MGIYSTQIERPFSTRVINRQIYSPLRVLLMKSVNAYRKVNSFDAYSSKYFGWRNIDAVVINSLRLG